MKKLRNIPCLPGWISAIVIGSWALFPTYAYVRLVPLAVSLVIVCYCLLRLLGRKKPEAARILRALFTTGVILGMTLVCVTGALILHDCFKAPAADCEYIVVLGAQVRDDGPSMSLRERINAAYDYLTAHPDTIAIVTGGKGSDEAMSEAACMWEELTAMGIPAERIWMEDQATSTWENLTYSLDIIEENTGSRPDSLGVVSSEYHLFRTALQAEKWGLEIRGIPAKTGSFDRFVHYFIREIFGVWHYILLGGQYS